MKITGIQTYTVNTSGWRNYNYIQILTDEGIYGVGEVFCVGPDLAVLEVIRYLADWVIGGDPLERERMQSKLLNFSRFPGGALLHAAVSAIDLALWDIAGKVAGLPVYQLLGGKCRDKVWVYCHAYGKTLEERHKGLAEKQNKYGYTAVKTNSPLLGYHPTAQAEKELVSVFEHLRKEYGEDLEISVDMGSKVFEPSQGIRFCNLLEPYRPMFAEEPIRPENIEELGRMAEKIRVPVATGEQLFTIFDYDRLLRAAAADILQPDILLSGGMTGMRRIAAMAEPTYRVLAPHNPLSPLANCINVHFAMATPNVTILENEPVDAGIDRDIVTEVLAVRDGYVTPPEGPGWGVDLNYEYLETLPKYKKWSRADQAKSGAYHHDGSVHIL